jgi:arylsulfate sulfotransferase
VVNGPAFSRSVAAKTFLCETPALNRTHLSAFVPYILTILLAGCGSVGSSVSATANPLVAEYTVHPALAGAVTVEFGEDTSYGRSTSPVHTTVGPTNVLVAGMKPNTTYHMRAHLDYENGRSTVDSDHVFTTGALPSGIIPNFTVSTTSGMTPQPGVEMVDIVPSTEESFVYATDLNGNVIWFYDPPESKVSGSTLYPVIPLSNGHFMCFISPASQSPLTTPVTASTPNLLREFDLAGNTIRQLTMADLNTKLAAANFHTTMQVFTHDFALLPNGHILVITNSIRTFTNLAGFSGPTNLIGDAVVDLDENFNPVWVWDEFDHFDVNRHPMGLPDWTHSNAVAYSRDDGNFLISIRHQHWIVKVDYRNGAGAGNVLWKLGYQGDFTLQGAVDPTDWFYAQHDVNFVSSNTTGSFKLAIMDNGNNRVFPPGSVCGNAGAPGCYSTIPVMLVDENARTASFLFHQILPSSLYSVFAGDTRILANTNVEYNLAGVGTNAYVLEETPTDTPQTVWEMQITGSNTYRALRMPSLYPGVQW